MSLYIYISSYWESTSNFQFLEHPLETASEGWRLQVCGFEKGWFILSVLFHFKTIFLHSASKCLLVWVFELIVFYKILRCSMRLNSRHNRFIKCINIFKNFQHLCIYSFNCYQIWSSAERTDSLFHLKLTTAFFILGILTGRSLTALWRSLIT